MDYTHVDRLDRRLFQVQLGFVSLSESRFARLLLFHVLKHPMSGAHVRTHGPMILEPGSPQVLQIEKNSIGCRDHH